MNRFGRLCGRLLFPALALGALVAAPIAGAAPASYPSKPVTLMVAFAPGGMGDVSVRMLAEPLQKALGQPMVIENKGGAGGLIGLQAALRAKPDGYVVAAGSPQQGIVASAFLAADGSKPVVPDDMITVCGFMPQSRALFVPLDSPFKTWEEFIAYAKANPGKVSIGFGGSQWSLDIMRYIAAKEGLKLKLVLYKSGGETAADFFGGHIMVGELGVGTPVYQAAKEGKARVLVNLSNAPVPGFPDLPSISDKGYDIVSTVRYGFAMPKGTPENVRAAFEEAVRKVLADEAVQESMRKIGFTPQFVSGKEHHEELKKDLDSLQTVINFNKTLKD